MKKIATINGKRGLTVHADDISDNYTLINIKIGDQCVLKLDMAESKRLAKALAKAAEDPKSKLHRELAAEQCKNCLYAEMTHSAERAWLKCRGLSLSNAGGATLCCDPNAELLVSRSFYCGHFEAKK